MKTSNVSQERWFMGSRSCFAAPSPEIEKSGNGVGTEHRTPCALATHELVIPTTLSSRYVAEVTGLSFALPLFSHWRSYKWSPNGVGGEGWELFLVFYSFSNSKYINSTRSTTNERETLRVTLPLALQWHTRTVRPFPSCPVSPPTPRKSFQMAESTPATISPPREQLLFIYLALLAELPRPVVPGPLERWWHSRNILCAAASRDSHFLVLQ